MNKEELITRYKTLKDELGYQPSSSEFYEKTGVTKWALLNIFGSSAFTKLVIECGDKQNQFSVPKSDLEKILIQFGELTRKLGKSPASADWLQAKLSPTPTNIRKNQNFKWGELQNKFFEFASNKQEWDDIISLIPNHFNDKPKSQVIENIEPELLKFIPPATQDLIELSLNEEKSREFENKVNLVFEMLGFDVEYYGQGTGRKPDGIARELQYHYAILIDTKSREDNYKIGTEDRKIIEYIKTFSEEPINKGFSNKYFLIVSSNFGTLSEKSIQNIKVETGVSTTLLTSKLLLKLLANKIKKPRLFDLKKFQKLLIEDGEISEIKIDKFLKGK